MNQIECESCGAIYESENMPTRLECMCKSRKFKIKTIKVPIEIKSL